MSNCTMGLFSFFGGGGLGGDSEPLGSKFQIFYDFIVSQCQKNDQKASESCH